MTELPYRPEHVNDAIADSEELSNEELGAYVRLQRSLWRAGGYLPAAQLGRFARAGKRWGALAPAILKKLTVIDGIASCASLLDTLLKTRQRRAAAVDKARKAGAASGRIRVSAVAFGGHENSRLNASKSLESKILVPTTSSPQASLKPTNQNQNKNPSLLSQNSDTDSRLFEEGVPMLMDRVGLTRLASRSQISKWYTKLPNGNALWALIDAVKSENLRGAAVVALIDQRVKTLKSEQERGPALPLGYRPNVVSK